LNRNAASHDAPEFANMLGTTRETVNRFFHQLKREQILTVLRKKVAILHPEALERYM
jgi:CRP-like cAMP-binding protein